MKALLIIPLVFGLVTLTAREGSCAEPAPADRLGWDKVVAPFLQEHCVRCHGPKEQKAKLRLDTLSGALNSKKDEVQTWKLVLKRLELGDMPPKEAKARPAAAESARITALLREHLGSPTLELAFPGKGNRVDHAELFGKPSASSAATPSRIWRISPFGYKQLAEGLAPGGGRQVVLPFGLTNDPGFRDYAFRYTVSGSETEQMVLNAKAVIDYVMTKRARYSPPKPLAAIATANGPPTEVQIQTAVTYLFDKVLFRDPKPEELTRYTAFCTAALKKFGNSKGLVQGLTPVMLHPEAVFRTECGDGKPDEHGRVMLAPIELAMALSYALTDDRPDAELIAAARAGKLATRDDVRREVNRLLTGSSAAKPRVMRFFQEYFGYTAAAEVFKDDHILKTLNIGSQYRPAALVADTDRLVAWVLEKDKDVLRELLTTDRSFVATADLEHWSRFQAKREADAKKQGVAPATHPFSGSKNKLNEHYNLPAEKWSAAGMPFALPREQRAGILTQPAWLIAHSTNDGNHAIHRGKWVRERLLGGSIPDTPITVEAKLPDELEQPLRHRMRVTRETYCWQCHQNMDPLGLPFEMFDHVGRFRTTELGKPVNTSGEVVRSGDAALDGPVVNAVEMIRKLAGSERVTQVFVRHAFRYWMGRNETTADAPTLQAAYKAYVDGGGSMKLLIAALLTSDSFLYRLPATEPARK